MHILDRIIETKKHEVAYRRVNFPIEKLEKDPQFKRSCNSLKDALLKDRSSGIIAEFKRKSPSKGVINSNVEADKVTLDYAEAGAAALSVLTDSDYFGGSTADLVQARKANHEIPILRKDFIIDPYQVTEARAMGADVILLIAACLDKNQAKILARHAKDLGMEVLMEVHQAEELELLNEYIDLAGVNNRNLKTFEVNIENSVALANLISADYVKVSESGLTGAGVIHSLREYGFRGFLIGETFMKTSNPGQACKKLISEL